MKFARIAMPLAFVSALAACSGNIGGGQSSLPGGPQTPQGQIAQPVATSTPSFSNNIASVGESTAPQPLPAVAGYGGTVSFPKPAATASTTPNPKASPTPLGGPLAVGITASIVEPTDAPKFNATGKKRGLLGKKDDPSAPKPLLFISLLATGDVTFDAYPKFAIDVPREIATKYRDGSFGLALFDPSEKGKRYRLSVAERDLSTPAPGATSATAKPMPTHKPTPVPAPSGTPGPNSGLPPPPLASPEHARTDTLPPQRIAFESSTANLTLHANRPVVFALYALPAQPSPSPSPATSATPKAAGSPESSPTPSGSPAL
ncbi:MAG: hypothetical protein NVSMB5_23520 [Candidatus Velthaea sp.]